MNQWIAPSVSLIVAALVVALTYRANRTLSQRQDRLARVNEQLEHFYGPLLALTAATGSAFEAMMQVHRPGKIAYFDGSPTSDEDAEVWVTWMQAVFMPANRQLYAIIVNKAHLLVGGDGMPQCLLDLCAHVAGYEAIANKWESGDYSELVSLNNYPGSSLREYASSSFAQLRRQQVQLLALTRSN